MLNFAQTTTGRKFVTSDIPRIASALERIAEALEKNLEPEGFNKGKTSLAREVAKEIGAKIKNLPHNGPA